MNSRILHAVTVALVVGGAAKRIGMHEGIAERIKAASAIP